jgi:tetratricopeptide (TPR) repeat protein
LRAAAGATVGLLLWCMTALGPGATPAFAAPPATANCERGRALEQLGRLGAAEQAYLEDLKAQASVDCGKRQLEQLRKAKALCATGAALAAAGQEDKAKEAYVEALKTEPESACAAAGAKPAEKESGWWSWMATAAKDVVGVLGFVLLGLALIAVAVWVLVMLQARGKRSRRRRPARWVLAPSLEVKALDDTGVEKSRGPAIASLIRSRVTPRSSGGIDVVTGHSAFGEALKPLSDISSEAKAAVSVVSFLLGLLPRRNYEATGALQAKGEHGLGISVELTNDSRQLGSTTLWGSEFAVADDDDEAKAFQRLSVPAAAWLDHQIATALEAADDLPRDPRGWALFKAASVSLEEGSFTDAGMLADAALTIDPANIWAMAVLGTALMMEDEFAEALEQLTQALAGFEGVSS